CVQLRCAMETRPMVESLVAVEPGEATGATGAKSETGEPAKGIAKAVVRPVVVTWRALGVVAGARPDAARAEVWGTVVSGWGERECAGCACRRSAQHGRGWERGHRVGWIRRWYRNNLGADRDRHDHSQDEHDADDRREHPVHAGSLSCHHHL